jgi:hypothetical protein
MAYPDYTLMPDSGGEWVTTGTAVTYHGSLPEAHGAWTYIGPCSPCCDGTGPEGELYERRMRLARKEPGGVRPLLHVSVRNVTKGKADHG